MKIKNKKTMNLPQLIEWGFNNPELVEGKLYLTKEHDEYSPYVRFSVDGYGVRTGQSIFIDDTFTVEVEETVTEDTKLPSILVKSNYDDMAKEYRDSKINDFVPKYTRAIYIINDDLTMTLIWRDGKLVE